MAFSRDQLPPDVVQALEQGRPIDAIKRLRKHTGVGLAEAKALVEAHVRRLQDGSLLREAHARHPAEDGGRVLPAEVVAALARGDKVEAIRILRERTGVGLKEARSRVESAHVGGAHTFTPPDESAQPRLQPPPPASLLQGGGGLAPGEVKQSNAAAWAVLLLLAVLAAYYFLG